MLDRLLAVGLTVLAVAVAIYVAVRLIEAVAPALLMIVAAIGGLVIVSFMARLWWHWRRADRW